jgi:uncharacterized protein DUF6090
MLNFLRKIRLKEMNGRYFKYAIGEIVLVVVGILIALSINNWNEGRKATNKEQVFKEQLLSDAYVDATFYESRQVGLTQSVDSYNELLRLADGHKMDTLKMHTRMLYMYYASQSKLIQNHPSAVDQISDPALIKLLQNYFGTYEFVSTSMGFHNRALETHFTPFRIQHFKAIGRRNEEIDLEVMKKLLQDTNLAGIVFTIRGLAQNALNQVDSMVVVNSQLVNFLEQKVK